MQPDEPKNYWQEEPDETSTLSDDHVEPDTTPPSAAILEVKDEPVSWTAQEYIHLEKGGVWFIIFVLVVLGLIASDIFFLKSYTFSVLVIVMAVATIVYIRRPPRTIQYALSVQHGLYIGEKLYSLTDFKAFGLIRDGEHHSIMLIPRKRFAPGVSVYFPEEAGEKIVDILGSRLPMEDLRLDVIDIVVRALRL
jgi:hypothetical protein